VNPQKQEQKISFEIGKREEEEKKWEKHEEREQGGEKQDRGSQ